MKDRSGKGILRCATYTRVSTDQGLASCMAVAVARPPLLRRLRSLSRTAAFPSRSPKKR